MDSGFQVLNSRYHSSEGFRIPWTEFQIPNPRILDSTNKNFSHNFLILQTKSHGFQNPDSLTCVEWYACGNRLFCLLNFQQDDVPSIALDIGCAVGRSTFELAKKFNQVIGIDFSHGFINAANKLKTYGKLPYTVQTEGSLVSQHVAAVDPDIVSRDVCRL